MSPCCRRRNDLVVILALSMDRHYSTETHLNMLVQEENIKCRLLFARDIINQIWKCLADLNKRLSVTSSSPITARTVWQKRDVDEHKASVTVKLHELNWFYYALYSPDLNKYVHFLSEPRWLKIMTFDLRFPRMELFIKGLWEIYWKWF